ncbi:MULTISPECIES: DUF4183 domain-containing protein [unclassified Bacillus (in: firmicutes)]|uniref:DUF4183 domain-containing protein n=1 Tax=unclassified Bacillus (in: firmicutes) TaxID=185979 RepID=UPI0008EBFBAC|nr:MULTISPECIES: DUF4183 domain-containing protein [unclassified Bacillus (in: firmicutes)]SFA72302.1 protein of unknown function [Bacillus sp. UNCCL13]SFQ62516.1 protein of unknown function [Bacillus sp. cl95]
MRIRKTTIQSPPPPFLGIPEIDRQEFYISPKHVEVVEFYTLSDGLKRIYTEKDALTCYGKQKILDPRTVSLINLFINGVLQPKTCYHTEKGKITILTEDVPSKGTPIILQMVKFY